MGHSSSRAALIYQHMTSDRDRAIADRLGAMIQGSERYVAEISPSTPTRSGSARWPPGSTTSCAPRPPV
ncbi:hypothetical protein ACFV20_25265 [Streptomyces sp. NPDC059696]|uniref:hypothetical protein n=1 Tax=Streptomyces sp. NPDC059696 TaxID=3346911 RepID=UPI0036BB1D4C